MWNVRPIGQVRSELDDVRAAPCQGDEGAPPAWLVIEPTFEEGLRGLGVGDEVVAITWLHRARRDVLAVHPRSDLSRSRSGVFSTRSAHRPNPIGLHVTEIVEIDGLIVEVSHLEAVDGTPILDLKPVLGAVDAR